MRRPGPPAPLSTPAETRPADPRHGVDAAHFREVAPTPARPPLPAGLLESKLRPPRLHAATIRRTRLLRQLRSARNRPLISIVAPAGFGKTSLLVQWASRNADSVAWLTADDGDNDPVMLLAYLAAAIDRVEPLDPGIFDAIASPAVSNRAVVGRLLVAMSRRAQPIHVAVDDAHQITDRACLDALAELVTYLPAGSQVAIAGREPPALPFSRWRADGSMLEIGSRDLAMDEQEAAGLGRQLGLELQPEVTERMIRQTEGWPALLALAALDAGRPSGREARSEGGSDRLIADYLRSELLEGHPDSEIAFLTRTSILERLTGPICDVVAERPGSTDILAGLARSSLLVDEYGGSYRYHSLLRDFLQGELMVREPERVSALHGRAAVWYEENDALDVAVNHAFSARDLDHAAALAGRGMLLYHWSGRRATALAWFRRFGDAALAERPWLAVLAAWEELAMGETAAALRLADTADRGTFAGRPPDGTASFESGRSMLHAAMVRGGADDALANATRAIDLEAAGGRWGDFALWMLATALLMKGDQAGAAAALADAIATARSARNHGLAYCLIGHRALLAVDGTTGGPPPRSWRRARRSRLRRRWRGTSRRPPRPSPAPGSPSIAATSRGRSGCSPGRQTSGPCSRSLLPPSPSCRSSALPALTWPSETLPARGPSWRRRAT